MRPDPVLCDDRDAPGEVPHPAVLGEPLELGLHLGGDARRATHDGDGPTGGQDAVELDAHSVRQALAVGEQHRGVLQLGEGSSSQRIGF